MEEHLELGSKSLRKARTRTLIQLGCLLEKVGLLDALDIALGSDLQKDSEMLEPMYALYGGLLELAQTLKQHKDVKSYWQIKGQSAFKQHG